jgi:hypothetical protein
MNCSKCGTVFDEREEPFMGAFCENVCDACCLAGDCDACRPGEPYTSGTALETLAEIETILLDLLSDGDARASFDGMSIVQVVRQMAAQFEATIDEYQQLEDKVARLEAALLDERTRAGNIQVH